MFEIYFYYTAVEGNVKNCPSVTPSFLAAPSNRECPLVPDDNRSIGLYCLSPLGGCVCVSSPPSNRESPMVPDDNRSIGPYCLSPLGDGKTPGGCDQAPGVPRKGLERREVEKRIYGVRRDAVHGFRNLSVIRVLFGFEHRLKET